jgi:ankyrin repeat protein
MMHYAANYKNEEVVRLLINYGANVNIQNQKGYTPISIAVLRGNKRLVVMLLEAGASLVIPSDDGLFPVNLAIKSGNKEIEEIIVKCSDTGGRGKY